MGADVAEGDLRHRAGGAGPQEVAAFDPDAWTLPQRGLSEEGGPVLGLEHMLWLAVRPLGALRVGVRDGGRKRRPELV